MNSTTRLMSLAATLGLILALPFIVEAQGASAAHGKIWGVIQTQGESAVNIFDRDTNVVVRRLHNSRAGRIVATSAVSHGRYSVDMDDLPAGKYLVSVDPGGDSLYLPGQAIVNYSGHGASVHQNWTLSMQQSAIPHLQ
jgi:hypothetical protein